MRKHYKMNGQIFRDAYIAKLTGIVEYKNDKQIWWKDDEGNKITIEFVDNSISKVIVKFYNNSCPGLVHYYHDCHLILTYWES
jgi:hypothetical protein